MTTRPSNRTFIAARPDGAIVSVRDDATISIIALSKDGADLVETCNGETKTLVENDPALAAAMHKSLIGLMQAETLPRTPFGSSVFRLSETGSPRQELSSTSRIVLLSGLCLAALLVTVAFFGQMNASIGSKSTLPTSVVEQAVEDETVVARPESPVIQRPTMTPDAPRTVEEINAEKGPQTPPESTEPPSQPSIELPSTIVVTPDEELAAPTDIEPTAEAPAVENPTSQTTTQDTPSEATAAPVATPSDAPANGDEAALENDAVFGDRLAENQAALDAMQQTARDEVAAAGPDLVAEQIDDMRAALETVRNGDKLTPEVVAKLPPEVAAVMRERGMVMTPEEAVAAANATSNAAPISIIRLPAAVVDRHRDPDGIPDIPEANSWLALGGGNGPSLPLPGSGEIRTPEDLGRFGLQY